MRFQKPHTDVTPVSRVTGWETEKVLDFGMCRKGMGRLTAGTFDHETSEYPTRSMTVTYPVTGSLPL